MSATAHHPLPLPLHASALATRELLQVPTLADVLRRWVLQGSALRKLPEDSAWMHSDSLPATPFDEVLEGLHVRELADEALLQRLFGNPTPQQHTSATAAP